MFKNVISITFKISAIVLFLLVGYLMLSPTKVDPVSWQSSSASPLPKPIFIEKYEVIQFKYGYGPEDIAIDNNGDVFGGLKNGNIEKVSLKDNKNVILANTQGRPLGLHFSNSKDLVIADSKKGLLKLKNSKVIQNLANKYQSNPFKYADDLDIANDGKVYFSDASSKYSSDETLFSFLESRDDGRLFVYDPQARETNLLLQNLHFANGIAVSHDEDFVLVVESTRYRITRYWLTGERKGSSDIFINNINGVPDGVSKASDGGYWVALVSKRSKILDKFSTKPFIRKIIARIPQWLMPKPKGSAQFLKLSASGKIEKLFQIDTTIIKNISSVEEYGDSIYLGSYSEPVSLKITTSSILKL
jgi:sugar lactone lactonase YvrE